MTTQSKNTNFPLYSPILVGVYDRYVHFQKCVESLQACPEAIFTTLFIASDAPYRSLDSVNIEKVRSYARSITGFNEVVLIEREENYGANNNWLDALGQVFQKHDRVIMLEDDVVVGAGFLGFLNSALVQYKDDERVAGACAYLPPGIKKPDVQPFFLQNRAPYGYGVWREKEHKIRALMNKRYVASCFESYSFFKKYEKVNPHVARAIPLVAYGDSCAGDILTGIVMQSKGLLAIYPPVSISKSIGNDGSGLHAGENKALQNQVASDERFVIPENLSVSLDRNMEMCVAKSLGFPGATILNYFVYLAYKFIPKTYPLYKMARRAVKRIRRLV